MSVRRQRYRSRGTGELKEYWIVDVDLQHPDGRQERVRKVSPIQTRRGAEQCERDLRQALLNGTYGREEESKREDRSNLSDFGDEFLRTYATVHNKPSEQAAKRSVLTAYLKPLLGHLAIDKIGTGSVESLKAALIRRDLSPKTVDNVLLVLRKMLNHAVDINILDPQDLPKIKMLKVPKQPFAFLDFEEAVRLVDSARTDGVQSYTAIMFALDTGARMGEQIALEWSDLDLKARGLTVRISRSDWHGQVTSTEGGNVRTVPLTARLVAALREWSRSRHHRVFVQLDGRSWTKEVCNRLLARVLKTAGLRRVTWHALRHTFASHLVMRDASLKAVQELLGHASITTTMRYAHLAPGHLRSTVSLLEQVSASPTANGRQNGPQARIANDGETTGKSDSDVIERTYAG
jgi:integrase